jgi:4'-phosphopantetheinyl transferase
MVTTRPGSIVHVVQLWRLALNLKPAELDRLAPLLAPEERERTARFRFPRDRGRFVAGRAQLRRVLGELTGTQPGELGLVTGAHGKPELPGSGLFFNLAHAEGCALLAVTTAGRVGVDIERLRPVPDRDLVAQQFFAPAEVAALRRTTPAQRDATFLRCWTRKEAYVKAVGDGLSLPLQNFAVSIDPAEAPRIVWSRQPGERLRWLVLDLSDSCPGHVAAAVVEHPSGVTPEGPASTDKECR